MKGEQILFPHVFRFFKGYGTMDCVNTIKKNVEVLYKEAVEEPVEEVKVVEPVIVKKPEPIPEPKPVPVVEVVKPPSPKVEAPPVVVEKEPEPVEEVKEE